MSKPKYQVAATTVGIPYGRIPIPGDVDIDEAPLWLQDLAQSFTKRGFSVAQVDNVYHVWDETRDVDIAIPFATLITALDNQAFFKDIRFGLRVSKTILDNLVPEGVPGSQDVTGDMENPVTSQKTYREWIESFAYRTKADDSDVLFRLVLNGRSFNSEEIKPLLPTVQDGTGTMELMYWRPFVAAYNGVDYAPQTDPIV